MVEQSNPCLSSISASFCTVSMHSDSWGSIIYDTLYSKYVVQTTNIVDTKCATAPVPFISDRMTHLAGALNWLPTPMVDSQDPWACRLPVESKKGIWFSWLPYSATLPPATLSNLLRNIHRERTSECPGAGWKRNPHSLDLMPSHISFATRHDTLACSFPSSHDFLDI